MTQIGAEGAGVCVVFGTRPEAVKLAPVVEELRAAGLDAAALATGQHKDLLAGMPPIPNAASLGIASDGSLLRFVNATRRRLEGVFRQAKPAAVVVQGDTMSPYAAALAAAAVGIPVAHVEAGVRSGNDASPWPEERLRIAIDELSRWRFAPTAHALRALNAAGMDGTLTGNTCVDAMRRYAPHVQAEPERSPLVVVTLHRRELRAHPRAADILAALLRGMSEVPSVTFAWPVHPGTAAMLANVVVPPNVKLHAPMAYVPFLEMIAGARGVLTDSGGLVEEAATLGVPTAVLRDATDRPEAEATGIARRFPLTALGAYMAARALARAPWLRMPTHVYGDGLASRRIAAALARDLATR